MRILAKAVSLMLLLCIDMPQPGFADAKGGEVRTPAIRISGSHTMLNLTRRLTEWYQGRNRGAAFQLEGSSPTQGFTALIESKAEIAQSTRKALDG